MPLIYSDLDKYIIIVQGDEEDSPRRRLDMDKDYHSSRNSKRLRTVEKWFIFIT